MRIVRINNGKREIFKLEAALNDFKIQSSHKAYIPCYAAEYNKDVEQLKRGERVYACGMVYEGYKHRINRLRGAKGK